MNDARRKRNAAASAVAPRVFALMAIAALLAAADACAQSRPAPLPPPRPSELGAPSAPRTPAAPAPSTTPAPATTSAAPATPPPIDPDHPPLLPAASRARMRECGREWQAIKKAGKDTDIGWREFATECLTREQPKR